MGSVWMGAAGEDASDTEVDESGLFLRQNEVFALARVL